VLPLPTHLLLQMQFVAIAIITSGDAIEHLVQHKSPENSFLIIIFAVITMVLLGAIGATKLWINKHVGSKALEQVRILGRDLDRDCVLHAWRCTPGLCKCVFRD